MNAHATAIIVYATMCAFLSCFAICIVKHMLAWVKCTKCHSQLLALSVFTLVSDNKDKNTQNMMVRLWGLILVIKIHICHLIKKPKSVLPSLGIHFSYYWQKLHLHWQVSFWLLSLCQKPTCIVVSIPSDMKTQQHTRVHISTTLQFAIMNTTPAAEMAMFPSVGEWRLVNS